VVVPAGAIRFRWPIAFALAAQAESRSSAGPSCAFPKKDRAAIRGRIGYSVCCMRLHGGLRLIACGFGLAALLSLSSAHAKPRAKPAPKPKATTEAAAEPAPGGAEPAKPAESETSVKAAGTKQTGKDPKDAKDSQVTAVEESAKDKGVKTYKFSAVEIEGRLKSPQIIYFLRRVRAEFEAGDLGHRSFVPELSDTRRSPSLR
jgi:hypothetical protein